MKKKVNIIFKIKEGTRGRTAEPEKAHSSVIVAKFVALFSL